MGTAAETVVLRVGDTVNEGVFSLWKGQRPLNRVPALRRSTCRPMYATISVRDSTSEMISSGITRPAYPHNWSAMRATEATCTPIKTLRSPRRF